MKQGDMEQRTAHAIDNGPLPIGTRIRRIRLKQGKTLAAVAGLAGITGPHLSRLERGARVLDSRRLADRIAAALGVPMASLLEEPVAGSDAALAAASLRIALAAVNPGDDPVDEPRPWPDVAVDTATVDVLRQRADFVGLSLMLPVTLAGLHGHIGGPQRRDALIGLTNCYRAAQFAARGVGAHDLGLLAGHHLETVTAHLDGPEWGGLAQWTRVLGLGSIHRRQAHTTVLSALDRLDDHLDEAPVAEVVGTLHLSAALSSAVIGRSSDVEPHLAEARRCADRVGIGSLADLHFSAWNVGAWATSIAVEMGEGGRAMEIAQSMDESTGQPVPCRRAAWLIDLGRGAATSAKTRPVAKRAFLEAEQIAPQRLRSDPWAQEVVTDLRNRARTRDWELENLAERMGIAV